MGIWMKHQFFYNSHQGGKAQDQEGSRKYYPNNFQ